jgi:organic radical activating enzyme|tara:strand:- start:963 stop:2348 length:1386 start_codon:yes stop_codon:yes gene_type:complete
MSDLEKYQAEIAEVSGTETFCVLPWIHMATRPNGDMRLCCTSNASGAGDNHEVGLVKMEDGKPANFGKHTPLEAWNNDYMKSVRTTMLNGEIPASCTGCFKEESQGIVSKRIWETGTWHRDDNGVDIPELIRQTKEDGTVPENLKYLDLRLGHTCNIKCIMCSPHDSSKWVADHKKLIPVLQDPEVKRQMQWDRKTFNNKWHEKDSFWKEINAQIPNLRQVYFAGGEPLMIKEHKMFIKEIIRQGYQDKILLRYNSNGLLVDEELIELWSKFHKVKFAVSVDASFERDDYIRFPTKFADVERTLHMLDNTPDNIHISMATAVQIFNIKHMPDFIKWKINSNFKKMNIGLVGGVKMGGGLVNMHLVHIPTFLNITILPEQDKQEVRERFAELKTWLWENYTQDDDFWIHNPSGWSKWEGLLTHMDSADNSHLLPGFKEYVNKLDAIRKLNAADIFPELAHLL